MVKKEFTYRGKTIEELQKLSIEEFAKLTPARQRRSLLRGFNEAEKKLLAKIKKYKAGKTKKPVKTHCRDIVVLPDMVGLTIHIHSGKTFVPITIEPDMIAHVLGEFTMNRQKVSHSAPGIGATRSSASASVK
ncbi:MAG TPA: 30S ribosomal protein S19 [Nanoarchaeota archaeon]|nr:30S ribosomal protein S19 [Nanoarchaeota archaeon]